MVSEDPTKPKKVLHRRTIRIADAVGPGSMDKWIFMVDDERSKDPEREKLWNKPNENQLRWRSKAAYERLARRLYQLLPKREKTTPFSIDPFYVQRFDNNNEERQKEYDEDFEKFVVKPLHVLCRRNKRQEIEVIREFLRRFDEKFFEDAPEDRVRSG